jgi:hypothetical protein
VVVECAGWGGGGVVLITEVFGSSVIECRCRRSPNAFHAGTEQRQQQGTQGERVLYPIGYRMNGLRYSEYCTEACE